MKIKITQKDQLVLDKKYLKNNLLPFFSETNISDIDYSKVSKFLDSLKEKNLDETSQGNHLKIINNILNLAVEDKLIQSSQNYLKQEH